MVVRCVRAGQHSAVRAGGAVGAALGGAVQWRRCGAVRCSAGRGVAGRWLLRGNWRGRCGVVTGAGKNIVKVREVSGSGKG